MKRLLLLAAVSFLFWTCVDPPGKNGTKSKPPVRVILLLDLSDRILMEGYDQINKDQEIIKGIMEVFTQEQKKFAFLATKDVIEVVVAPESGVIAGVNDKLRIDMQTRPTNAKPGQVGLPGFNKKKEVFFEELANLYDQASTQANPGADIYTFFCSNLQAQYLHPGTKTKVIVVTDGYLLFDREVLKKRPAGTYMKDLDKMNAKGDKWKEHFINKNLALKPCPSDISAAEVLMLEVAPKGQGVSVHGYEIVEHYWKTWFEAMGVKATVYPHQPKIANIKGAVGAFLRE